MTPTDKLEIKKQFPTEIVKEACRDVAVITFCSEYAAAMRGLGKVTSQEELNDCCEKIEKTRDNIIVAVARVTFKTFLASNMSCDIISVEDASDALLVAVQAQFNQTL